MESNQPKGGDHEKLIIADARGVRTIPPLKPGQILQLPVPDETPEQQPPTADIKLRRFDDGSGFILRFCPNPINANTFAIFTADGETVAVATRASVADMICRTVKLAFDIEEELAQQNRNRDSNRDIVSGFGEAQDVREAHVRTATVLGPVVFES